MKRFGPAIIIPLVVFLLTKVMAFLVAYAANCQAGFGPECWVRWDSALYLDIAANGHNLFLCGPEQGHAAGSEHWCGNAGWAPLYPLFIRILHSITGASMEISALFISNFFFLAYLLVCAKLITLNSYKPRFWLLMLIFAFCPGNIYFHAVFPLAQVAFFMALLFYFLQKERFFYAGIAGFFAVLSYSIGFFLLAVLGLFGIYLLFRMRSKFIPFALGTGLTTLLGLLTLFAYDQYSTGHWNALFMIQGKYGHGLNSPLKMLGAHFEVLLDSPYSIRSWQEIQNMVVVVYVLLVCGWRLSQKGSGIMGVFEGLFLLVFWFLPFSASTKVALYRNAATLGPGHSALRNLPIWVLALVALVFVGLSYPLGVLFVQSILI